MFAASRPSGYALVEIVVALLLFGIAALALVASAALVGRELRANGTRERAARVAANRLELLGSACAGATGGAETQDQIESAWSVGRRDSIRLDVTETVRYVIQSGLRADVYRTVVSCR